MDSEGQGLQAQDGLGPHHCRPDTPRHPGWAHSRADGPSEAGSAPGKPAAVGEIRQKVQASKGSSIGTDSKGAQGRDAQHRSPPHPPAGTLVPPTPPPTQLLTLAGPPQPTGWGVALIPGAELSVHIIPAVPCPSALTAACEPL